MRAALAEGAITLAAARAMTAAPMVLQRDMLDRILRGDPSLRRGEDIAAQVRAAVWPTSRSLFDRARYDGPSAEDAVTGEELLLDVEQCRYLQRVAIDARVETLKSERAWVRVMDHNDWWTPGGGDRIVALSDLSPGEDVQGSVGAVVRVTGALDVTIFDQLVHRPKPMDAPAAATPGAAAWTAPVIAPDTADRPPRDGVSGAPDPVAMLSEERRREALRSKTRALQAAILCSPGAWRLQLVLALLGCHEVCDVLAPPPRPENAVVAEEVRDVLARFRAELGPDLFLPIDDSWPYLSLTTNGPSAFLDSVTEAALALLPRLQALPDDEVELLLAALTASRCATRFLPARANLGDGPLVLATAAAVGFDDPMDGGWLDVAYLATLTDAEFVRILRANPNAVRHLAPELRFAARADIETALRAGSDIHG